MHPQAASIWRKDHEYAHLGISHRAPRLDRRHKHLGGSPRTTSSGLPIAGQDPPVTLNSGISDPRGRQSEEAALKFVERVAALSDGNISIEPTFGAGDGTNVGFETSVDELVKRGDVEFAMAGTSSGTWPA